MLNRIVTSFYWMGRYTERIDHHARLLDVNTYGHFKLNDKEDYDNSIRVCLTNVRNNVREVRQYATNRMWDTVNSFYLWYAEADSALEQMPFQIIERVRNEVSLFKNVADSSMLHEVEWGFLKAGEQLESAENTARSILLVVDTLADEQDERQSIDYHHLVTILECVDGFEAFRKIHANHFTIDKIIEFLLLNSVFSKSTYFALFALEENLKGLKLEYQLDHLSKVIRLINRLRALLYQCLDLNEKSNADYRELLNSIIYGCSLISQEIEKSIAYEPEMDIKDHFHRKLAELV